jgi:hypothetical protein
MNNSIHVLSFDVGIKNLAYCYLTYSSSVEDPLSFTIQEWNVINIGTDATHNKIKYQSDILFQKLRELFYSKAIDYVVIENQPVLKNPTMKSIQMMIYSFFKIMMLSQDKCVKDVVLVNACNKLKFATVILPRLLPDLQPMASDSNITCKYKKSKYTAIQYTKELLRCKCMHTELTFFNEFKKKDDLADTLLQGLYFAHNNKQHQDALSSPSATETTVSSFG